MYNQKSLSIPVDEFTSPCPTAVDAATPVDEIINMMQKEGIRHIPVVDKLKPVGIISDRDLKVISNIDFASKLMASDIMTPQPYVVSPSTSLETVAYEMSKNKYGSAIVEDESGSICGIFTSTDALNALIEVLRGDV